MVKDYKMLLPVSLTSFLLYKLIVYKKQKKKNEVLPRFGGFCPTWVHWTDWSEVTPPPQAALRSEMLKKMDGASPTRRDGSGGEVVAGRIVGK